MVVLLALILMLAAIAAVIGIASTGGSFHVDFYGMSAGHHSIGAIFAMGAVAGVVFALGVMLLRDGAARTRARRAAARDEESRRIAEDRALRERNAQLERSLRNGDTGSDAVPAEPSRPTVTSGRHAR